MARSRSLSSKSSRSQCTQLPSPPAALLRRARALSHHNKPRPLAHRPTEISYVPQLALQLEQTKVNDINVEVGSVSFALWFVISSYLPIFTACVAPLTTMMSIAGLVTKWRMDDSQRYVHDSHSIVALNSVSLALGALANLSLIMNWGRRLPYVVSQIISISLFFAASMILLSGILIANHIYFNQSISYSRTEGFWFAVLTAILHFLCSITCLINFSGFLLGKYPPDFNLEKSERGLIAYTFLLSIWFLWGAGTFSALMGLSFGDAMYYCCVSLLTIGLGDLLPHTVASKIICLIFSLTGIIILGLIIAMVRSMSKSTSTPVLFWNQVERARKKVFAKVKRDDITLTPEESFDLMRSIRKESKIQRYRTSIILVIALFIVFWLIGALVFHFTEDWDYFDCVYFCFLCLITIGYGDFAPSSAAGRPFFILWSLSAVPLMTCLISSAGDTVYNLAVGGFAGKLLEKVLPSSSGSRVDDKEASPQQNTFLNTRTSEDFDDDEQRSINEILDQAKRNDPRSQRIIKSKNLIKDLRKLIVEAKQLPKKRYAFEEWETVMQLLEFEGMDETDKYITDRGWFWISDTSPLRYPINEPDYLLYLLFNKLEQMILEKAQLIADELNDHDKNMASAGASNFHKE